MAFDRTRPAHVASATRLLILSRYDRQGASSRLRTMQYIPYLSAEGFEPQVASLFDAAYLQSMYSGRRNPLMLARYLRRRLRQLRTSADLIWLEKEALPWVPWLVERAFWPRSTPMIVDYDDAIFHRYDASKNSLVRFSLGHKIDRIMAAANIVFAGNSYLAERAKRAGAGKIEIVPTVVDTDAYRMQRAERQDGQLRIGWIGTPETWQNFARDFAPIFAEVAAQEGALCRLIGAEPVPRLEMPFEYLPWSEETEIAAINGMDVGLMPLPDTPWTRGKCGYKLIQYMACGLPVVASPVGVNAELVEHGVNGFLAETEEEWRNSIAILLSDRELREHMGAAGRRRVGADFSLQAWAPRVTRMLHQATGVTRK